MTCNVYFRKIQSDDGPAPGALIAGNPSSGMMSFRYEYQAGALEVHKGLENNLQVVVVVSNDEMIGMVFGDRTQIQLDGEVVDIAYVSNLGVHPDFQRQGIAQGLSDFGLVYAEKVL